jgi:hypothetical protein
MVDPGKTVAQLCEHKYSSACAIFWAGSVATGSDYTNYSDLDYELLAEFYFRAQNKWSASGKMILQFLKKQNYDLACLYRDAFDDVFKHGHTQQLNELACEILEPYGGLLWDGYHADAPKKWIIKPTTIINVFSRTEYFNSH